MGRQPPAGPLASPARIAGQRVSAESALMIGFFIQRPIFASAIAAILVLAGAVCFSLLPVSQFPEITPAQVVVSGTLQIAVHHPASVACAPSSATCTARVELSAR
jgi:hypothetical protein